MEKIKGKKQIREGDGKNNTIFLKDWWVVDDDDLERRIIFFDKNLRFHTRTKKDILLTMFNMKFHKKKSTKYLWSLFISSTNNHKLGSSPNS